MYGGSPSVNSPTIFTCEKPAQRRVSTSPWAVIIHRLRRSLLIVGTRHISAWSLAPTMSIDGAATMQVPFVTDRRRSKARIGSRRCDASDPAKTRSTSARQTPRDQGHKRGETSIRSGTDARAANATPMLVICDGMPRSGSTWSFNVVLHLLCRAEPGCVLHSGYEESLPRFLEWTPPSATGAVLKCHDLDPLARALVQMGAALVIYTWREPADAVASCMRMFGQHFDAALAPLSLR
jgi:hypothetical protein